MLKTCPCCKFKITSDEDSVFHDNIYFHLNCYEGYLRANKEQIEKEANIMKGIKEAALEEVVRTPDNIEKICDYCDGTLVYDEQAIHKEGKWYHIRCHEKKESEGHKGSLFPPMDLAKKEEREMWKAAIEKIHPGESSPLGKLVLDTINSPSHYNSHPSGIECIEITQHHNCCISNALKYLWRQGLKDGAPSEDDLNKAIWYIMKELQNNGMKVTAKEWTHGKAKV